MGREIRRVPKGWQHPENEQCPHIGANPHEGNWIKPTDYQWGRCFIPLYDKDYETAAQEWLAEFDSWRAGTHPSQTGRGHSQEKYYWDYEGMPPDQDSYRPKFETEPTCYQVYETVSEGTPTSPVFDTLDELIVYLISQGYSEAAAHNFAHDGWAPSMVMKNPGNGQPVKIWNDIESAAIPKND